jgi:hypothetical protein
MLTSFGAIRDIVQIGTKELEHSKTLAALDSPGVTIAATALPPLAAVAAPAVIEAAPELLPWILNNPNTALAVTDAAVAIVPQVVDAGGPIDYVKALAEDPSRLVDVAMAMLQLRQARGADIELGGGEEAPARSQPTTSPDEAIDEATVGTGSKLPTDATQVETPAAGVSTAGSQRVTSPVPGVFDGIDPEAEAPTGWRFSDSKRTDGTVITNVVAPNGATGRVERRYDPASKQWVMVEAFFDKEMPRWIKGSTSMVEGKGTPLIAFLDMRLMKTSGVAYGALTSTKLSTIQNVEAICQLEAQVRAGATDLDEAVLRTHSVSYAETELVQSGHRVVRAHIVGGQRTPISKMLEHYESFGFRTAADHDAILGEYGVQRTDVVLWDYDIYLELAPFDGGTP